MNRRGFLQAMLVAGIAPAIVKAANIMPIFVRAESGLLLPRNSLLSISIITQEALKILEEQLIDPQFSERFLQSSLRRLTIEIDRIAHVGVST